MPNWCWCNLTVKGDRAELDRFKSVAEHDGTYCRWEYDEVLKKAVRPDLTELPDDIQRKLIELAMRGANLKKDGFNNGGYEWCKDVWGTKWGFCHPTLSVGENTLHYDFTSAWSPPTGLLEKMAEDFPALEFDLDYECEGECQRYSISYGGERCSG